MAVNTYYFDASDAGPTDAQGVWTDDADAFDGSISTSATCDTDGSTSTNFLFGGGTNTPSSGGSIAQVRARIYAGAFEDHFHYAAIYTDGLSELLETAERRSSTPDWGDYIVLDTPAGGWTWAKVQTLETKIYVNDDGIGIPAVYRVEIVTSISSGQVTSAPLPIFYRP